MRLAATTVDRSPWLDEHSGLILAATLGLAGAFQFPALKERRLTACRDPLSTLWRHYRRGPRGAWRLGIRHALSCLGCCWALMLLMFATGVASAAWMLLLTAIMVAEKTTRWGLDSPRRSAWACWPQRGWWRSCRWEWHRPSAGRREGDRTARPLLAGGVRRPGS